MRRALLVILLLGCAAERREAAPPHVDALPSWVEGPVAAAPGPNVASHAAFLAPPRASTVSLGSDAPVRAHRGKKIDLDLVNADLTNVCRLLGELGDANVVVSDGVTGSVTVKMKAVAWDEALDAILASKGYVAERVGTVIVVRAVK